MIVRSIRHPELFEVAGAGSDGSVFGCDQEWYNSEWQRLSGCGPTAASNIIYYLSRTRPQVCGLTVEGNKTACLSLMEKMWTYVTPTEEGVDTAWKLRDALQSYFDAAGIAATSEVCDMPENRIGAAAAHRGACLFNSGNGERRAGGVLKSVQRRGGKAGGVALGHGHRAGVFGKCG